MSNSYSIFARKRNAVYFPRELSVDFYPQGEDYERYLMKSEKKAEPSDSAFCQYLNYLILEFPANLAEGNQ